MFTYTEILTPLALMVVIDDEVRAAEMDAFCAQAQGLMEIFERDALSPEALRKWYDDHQADLKHDLSSTNKPITILRAFTRFKDRPEAKAIYEAMLAISISDKEYHAEESGLLKSAASIWGL